MTGLPPLVWPALGVAVMMTILVGTRQSSMTARGTGIGWCVAGVLAVVLLGLLLADAVALLSSTERLSNWELAVWLPMSDAGIEDVAWAFQITPLAAWWIIGCGGLMCLIGWEARRSGESLPFGWLGGALWLVTCGGVFAENLLTAFLLFSLQGLLCGLWLAWQSRTAEAVGGVQRWLLNLLLSDTVELTGVWLAGWACRTFQFALLGDVEFLQRAWHDRPALCGLAGSCLFLGLLGRCALFPCWQGSRFVTEFNGPANALVHGVFLWPASMWLFLRVQPLLGSAPETVAVVQGLALVAAVIGAFLAAGQTDRRRATALLVTSQLGLLMSALAAPGVFSPIAWSLAMAPLAIAAATLLLASSPSRASFTLHRCVVGAALLTAAGGCPSPAFWLAGRSVQLIQAREAAKLTSSALKGDDSPAEFPDSPLATAEPLPATSWTAGWCLWSFFAAFAAWRAGTEQAAERPSGGAVAAGDKHHGAGIATPVSLSRPVSGVLLVGILLGAAGCAWTVRRDFEAMNAWPWSAAALASLAGLTLSARVCRDPSLADQRWHQLGSWTRLAQREFYLEEICQVGVAFPVRGAAIVVRFFDWSLTNPAGRWLGNWLARSVVSAGEELQTEPAAFYAGAVLLTAATLLVTWLAIAH